MIVAIDTLLLSSKHRYEGTHVYLSHLVSEWLRIAETAAPEVEFHGFAVPGDSSMASTFSSRLFNVRESRLLAWKPVWTLGGMALSTALVRPDVVFLPTAHNSIPGPFAPVVTTILDTMPKALPSYLVAKARLLHCMTWINAKLANRIITISSWSKQDLVQWYGLDPGAVEVIYLGYDKHLYNDAPPDAEDTVALLTRLGIQQPFVLHHGTVQLRKNHVRLIQAWDRVVERRQCLDAQLVLAGQPGKGYRTIAEAREASPNRERIIFTGALPDAELSILVKSAALSVIPSLYEGFCLPMVESMACGVPTIASNTSCMPEISGGTLEYFDPLSVEEMAQVIARALGDSALRGRLRRGGLACAAKFSWERCARETLHVVVGAAKHGQKHPVTSRF